MQIRHGFRATADLLETPKSSQEVQTDGVLMNPAEVSGPRKLAKDNKNKPGEGPDRLQFTSL